MACEKCNDTGICAGCLGEGIGWSNWHCDCNKGDIEKSFNENVGVRTLKHGDHIRYEAYCKKGLFSVDAPKKKDAIAEAKHYFQQYYSDGEYDA